MFYAKLGSPVEKVEEELALWLAALEKLIASLEAFYEKGNQCVVPFALAHTTWRLTRSSHSARRASERGSSSRRTLYVTLGRCIHFHFTAHKAGRERLKRRENRERKR